MPDDKIQCDICPRKCTLNEGEKGFCRVNANVGGKMVCLTDGYTTGLAIDPIEKKPLYHFLPASKSLSFGTYGCNMGFLFCQNWHTSKSDADVSTCSKAKPAEISFFAVQKKCRTIAFTYNDPVVFMDYAIKTAQEAHKLGIKTVAVSAGYMTQKSREKFFKHIDAANIDLKAITNDFYKRNCFAELKPVLDTILYIKNETNVWLELTTLLIECENESDDDIKKECDWILKHLGDTVPLHFSAFRPEFKFLKHPPTSPDILMNAYNIAKSAGLKYVYLGNIINSDTSTTYCKKCGKPLIRRCGYKITSTNLTPDLKCNYCKTALDGVFA